MSNDHDWRKMMHEFEQQEGIGEEFIYDKVDMKSNYDVGFWIGAVAGVVGTLALLLLVGLYYNGWQWPG